MRIFQIITVSEYGGAQTVVANLLSEFNKDKTNDLFVLSGGNGEAWTHLSKTIKKIKLGENRKNISWRDAVLLLRLFYYRFKYRPDIVHLHSSKMGVLGRIAFPKSKIIYTVHGFDSVRKAYSQYLIFEKKLKDKAAYIVPVSQYDAAYLKEEGIEKNVKVIYNGQDDFYEIDKGCHTIQENVEKQLIEIKAQYSKVIMCIARISQQKKFDLFLDIAQDMPQYAFVWIGNKDKIDNTPANVFCIGECHSAHQCLAYADLFILPSNYEGLPISVIEALSYGKPIVASDVGGVKEMLNSENGFVVDNNKKCFEEKIEYIFRSEEDYEKFACNARQSFLNYFTIDKMIKEYAGLYSSIYNRKRSG